MSEDYTPRIANKTKPLSMCSANNKNGEHEMTSTSRKLTETLKQARKERYFTVIHDIASFAFAWEWPQHIDWGMTSSYASNLYSDVSRLMDAMTLEGKTLTSCQRRLLTD